MLKCKSCFFDFFSRGVYWLVIGTFYLMSASCMASSASGSENQNPIGSKVSSAVNFSIVIPEVLRILENNYPPVLMAAIDIQVPRISAAQRIVVLSTMGKGFCMDMSLKKSHITDWNLRLSGSTGSSLEQTAEGYRLCLRRAGRYELALQHEFELGAGSLAIAKSQAALLAWPVNLSVVTP